MVMKATAEKETKDSQRAHDDLRAWAIIGLILCLATLALWLPLFVDLRLI